MSFHTIIFVGNLGRDPEMRYTPAGEAVTNFSVAINDNYTDKQGQKVERTIWIRVSTGGRQAETCNQYLKKGRKVLVEGRLVPDNATGGPRLWNRQDGTVAASYEVSAQTVRFLSSKGDADDDDATSAPAGNGGNAATEDSLPF